MVFRHFTQRVDVFPGFPAMLFCRCTAVKRPSDIDLTDDPPHYLDPRWRREGGRKVIMGLITTNQSFNLFAKSSIIWSIIHQINWALHCTPVSFISVSQASPHLTLKLNYPISDQYWLAKSQFDFHWSSRKCWKPTSLWIRWSFAEIRSNVVWFSTTTGPWKKVHPCLHCRHRLIPSLLDIILEHLHVIRNIHYNDTVANQHTCHISHLKWTWMFDLLSAYFLIQRPKVV